jgi:hypothetical protein
LTPADWDYGNSDGHIDSTSHLNSHSATEQLPAILSSPSSAISSVAGTTFPNSSPGIMFSLGSSVRSNQHSSQFTPLVDCSFQAIQKNDWVGSDSSCVIGERVVSTSGRRGEDALHPPDLHTSTAGAQDSSTQQDGEGVGNQHDNFDLNHYLNDSLFNSSPGTDNAG